MKGRVGSSAAGTTTPTSKHLCDGFKRLVREAYGFEPGTSAKQEGFVCELNVPKPGFWQKVKSEVMKNRTGKLLCFPRPLPQPSGTTTVTVQIGNDRFAIHFEMEELPPAAPLVVLTPAAKQVPTKAKK